MSEYSWNEKNNIFTWLSSLYNLFKLFIIPPDIKKAKFFQGLYPKNFYQGSAMNLFRSLQHLEAPTCILQHSKTQSLFKNRH